MASSRFTIRPATKNDVPAMTEVFFRSFNAPFWQYFLPDVPANRQWWDETWGLGLDNPTDRTFVVEDTEKSDRIVAFVSRSLTMMAKEWQVPQEDGNQERKWPAIEGDQWDMEVVGALFGGMEVSRHELMGKRPHWFLELLGVHEDYQRSGIGGKLIEWGTNQADKEGLETYLDGSEKGQPYYVKHHGFEIRRAIEVPDRPAYGSFTYKSLVRPAQGTKS